MAKLLQSVFSRKNYCVILVSVGLLITGFLLMSGSGHNGLDSFNDDIYSFRRITLAPVVLLLGYILMIYGIMTVQGKKNI